MARAAAVRLYEEVALSGMAAWDATTHELLEFEADALESYEGGDLLDALEALRRTPAANAWRDQRGALATILELRQEGEAR